MNEYTSFANVYDIFMDNVPYKEWADTIVRFLSEDGINEGLVLELGCGTGSMTEELASRGYDMIGVDYSEEMLEVAIKKREESGHDILYLHQDMREFELYGTVKAVISICDSINYILEKDDLLEVFRLVNNYLDPGGLFLFDLNSVYKYESILADHNFSENTAECSFIWDNYYDVSSGINEYELTIFAKQESGLYEKYEEVHYQKAYEIDEIKELIAKAGMEFLDVFDAYSGKGPNLESDRILFLAKEKGKVSL